MSTEMNGPGKTNIEIRRNLLYLSKHITNIDEILIHLVQDEIISNNEYENISNIQETLEINFRLLKLLEKKDWSPIRLSFLQILRDTNNSHCADIIENSNLLPSHQDLTEYQIGGLSSNSSIQPELPSSNGKRKQKGLINDIVSSESSKIQKLSPVLNHRWWPEEKCLPSSFYKRKFNEDLLIEKFRRMFTKIDADHRVVITKKIAVSGLGGIGKTTTAKWFALNYQNEYDYIIWIDCGERSLLRSFTALKRALKVHDTSDAPPKELANNCYKKLKEWKCLFIFDNAESYIGEQGIRELLPKPCFDFYVIITSRNRDWGNANGDGKISQFTLNVFEEIESLKFLNVHLTECEYKGTEELKALGKFLGHLPLALQIAVATINRRKLSLQEYIEKLHSTEHIINSKFDDYERTINKAMQVSLESIRTHENNDNGLAYRVLLNLGYIATEDVNYNFLESIEGVNKAKIDEASDLLERYSLITKTKVTKSKYSLRSHPLLQQVIRQEDKSNRNKTLTRILGCKGFLEYKLIPFSYADEKLKSVFPRIRDEIMDKVQLNELLKEKRYAESVELSRLIVKANDNNVSRFNYAVCLKHNFQIGEAKQIIKDLYGQFDKSDDGNGEISKWGIVTKSKTLTKSVVGGQLVIICLNEKDEKEGKNIVTESVVVVIPREALPQLFTSASSSFLHKCLLNLNGDKNAYLSLSNKEEANSLKIRYGIFNLHCPLTSVNKLELTSVEVREWNVTGLSSLIINNGNVEVDISELQKLETFDFKTTNHMMYRLLNRKGNQLLDIKNLKIIFKDSKNSGINSKEYGLLFFKYIMHLISLNQISYFSLSFTDNVCFSLSSHDKEIGSSIKLNCTRFPIDCAFHFVLEQLKLKFDKTDIQYFQFVIGNKVDKIDKYKDPDLVANGVELKQQGAFCLFEQAKIKTIVDFLIFLEGSSYSLNLNGKEKYFSLFLEHKRETPIKKFCLSYYNEMIPFSDDFQELELNTVELVTPLKHSLQKLNLSNMKVDMSHSASFNEVVLDNVTVLDWNSAKWCINKLTLNKMNFVDKHAMIVTEMTLNYNNLVDISVLPISLHKLKLNRCRLVMPLCSSGQCYQLPANIKELDFYATGIMDKDGKYLKDISHLLPFNLNKLKIQDFYRNRYSLSMSCFQSIQSLDLKNICLMINHRIPIAPKDLTFSYVTFIDKERNEIPFIHADDFIDFRQMDKLVLIGNKAMSVTEINTLSIKHVYLGDKKSL